MEGAEDPNGAATEGAGEASEAPPEGAGEPESADAARAPYVVPRYRAEGDPAWYHVLHGTVPGHQIDFMYCPDVPQGRLAQNHFGHLSRLMKYIEPRQGAPFAFALGNLSRDDVQHEPGHGGLALIFALRVAGVTDHAGRAMPPYAHGVLAVDRVLDYATLLQAITVFYRRFLDSGAQAEDATGSFYRAYVRVMREQRESVERFLHEYIRDFDDLPQPPRSTLRFDWEADEEALPKRVTIVHADDEPFENIAHAAALLGAMLYKSNIKWTAITSGRGIEIPGGVSIHIVPASEAPRDGKGLVVPIGELPDRESEVAVKLFGAIALHVETKVTRAGWREAMAASKAEDVSASGTVATSPRTTSPNLAHSSNRPPPVPSAPPPAPDAEVSVDFDEAATIPAPLERDPAFDPRRSSPMKGVPSAFDPRRSSPTKGVPSAFDPRRSSPVTGIVAASAGAAAVPAGKLSSVPPPPPSGNVDGPAAREPDARASQRAAAELERMNDLPAPKSRLGMWIGIAGGLGVIAAIAAALAGGTGDASSGSGATGAPSSSGSSSAAPPSASGTTVTATSASSSPEAPTGPSGAASTPEPGAGAAPVSSGNASAKDAPTSAAVTSTGAKTRPPATSTKTKRPSLRIP